ncbi:unnamed protein product, partial [Symbiodinium sp. KB8]
MNITVALPHLREFTSLLALASPVDEGEPATLFELPRALPSTHSLPVSLSLALPAVSSNPGLVVTTSEALGLSQYFFDTNSMWDATQARAYSALEDIIEQAYISAGIGAGALLTANTLSTRVAIAAASRIAPSPSVDVEVYIGPEDSVIEGPGPVDIPLSAAVFQLNFDVSADVSGLDPWFSSTSVPCSDLTLCSLAAQGSWEVAMVYDAAVTVKDPAARISTPASAYMVKVGENADVEVNAADKTTSVVFTSANCLVEPVALRLTITGTAAVEYPASVTLQPACTQTYALNAGSSSASGLQGTTSSVSAAVTVKSNAATLLQSEGVLVKAGRAATYSIVVSTVSADPAYDDMGLEVCSSSGGTTACTPLNGNELSLAISFVGAIVIPEVFLGFSSAVIESNRNLLAVTFNTTTDLAGSALAQILATSATGDIT